MQQERYINPYIDFGFKFLEAAEIARFTPEERWAYEESVKVFRDNDNTVQASYMKEKTEERRETARKIKAKGFSLEDITEISRLSKNEIEKLIINQYFSYELNKEKRNWTENKQNLITNLKITNYV